MQNEHRRCRGRFTALPFIILHSSFCISLSGCGLLGVSANAVPQVIKAKYNGLQNQSIGVMVWADRGILIDWESIQLDLANAVHDRLQGSKAEELKGAVFEWRPASIVRYQRDHPGIEALPVTDVAAKLPFTRLIYIEVQGFRTRSQTAVELYRGHGVVSVKVIEVDPGTRDSHVAFAEDEIQTVFPRNAPPDGLPRGDDVSMYNGTVQGLADEVVKLLVTHEAE
jgi:hypothetical protein